MADSLQAQLDQLRHSMKVLEAQRPVLGDEVVAPALAALRQQLAALEAQSSAQTAPVEERRIITVLFMDVVGSTALAGTLDPEDWHDVVAALHGMGGDLIHRHHGSVVQYLGDGLLALFGVHGSSEGDPENAVRAALDIQASSPSLRTDPPIRLRIGIHTGLVMMGEIGSISKKEFTATGDAMNLASRLQSAAPPGGVLISHDTYRYVRGVFDMTTQPPLTVKGKPKPIQTYLVHRAKPRPFRTVTRGVAGIETRTVGREAEQHRLQAAYLDAMDRRKVAWAQLVGEPGVGKSRLLDDFAEYSDLRPGTFRWLRARAFEGDEKKPFTLIRRMWFDRFQITEDAPLAEAETRWVEQYLALRGADFEEAAHALGLLVGLPFADSRHIGAMRNDPSQVKGRAFVVSREFLKLTRDRMPLVILLEDLHWADKASWEYITQVILERSANEGEADGLFVLATARPEWDPPSALLDHPDYLQIDLSPLSDEDSRDLAAELLQNVEDVPENVVQLIVERSEGMPYYAEEMVNWFLDRGIIDRSDEPWRFVSTRFVESPLPATLQHLLFSRLSVLSDTERATLQRGSVFGRNFWTGGLHALGVRAGKEVLGHLQPRGFVEAQPESSFEGEIEWSFHHNLLRDVTYESVLKRERPALHKAAAAWLEEQARQAKRLDEFAGLLGEHAERAGESSAAAQWYLRAGGRAKVQGAPLEARRFFDRVLELIPPNDRELRWLALLGRDEVLSTIGEPETRRADNDALLALAREFDDPNRVAEAHYRQGSFLKNLGEDRSAVEAFEKALTAARRAENIRIETLVLALMVTSQIKLGQTEAAAQTAQEALARARRLGDEAILARVVTNVAIYYAESGDLARAAQLENQGIEINHRLGDRSGEAIGLGNLGYSYVQLGLYDMGQRALERSLQLNEAMGARRPHAYNLLNLGLAYWRSGDNHAARQVLEHSFPELAAVGDVFGRAAGLSYLALTFEQSEDMPSAIRCFTEANEILVGIGVRGYANDALAGLARCALAQGQLDEARRRVSEVWDYLTQHGVKSMEFPIRAYQTSAEVFDALGESKESRAAAETGYHELMERAEKISDPDWRRSFLENVPEHHAIKEIHERMGGQ